MLTLMAMLLEQFETITFLTSLLWIRTDFLLHQMDIDGDGDDDIQVGLTVNLNNIDLSGAIFLHMSN